MPRDAGKHRRTDFIAIMKSEYVVAPPHARENAMGAGLPFDRPADAKKRL